MSDRKAEATYHPDQEPPKLFLLMGATAQQATLFMEERGIRRTELNRSVFLSGSHYGLSGLGGNWEVIVGLDSDPRPFTLRYSGDDLRTLGQVNALRELVLGLPPYTYPDLMHEHTRRVVAFDLERAKADIAAPLGRFGGHVS